MLSDQGPPAIFHPPDLALSLLQGVYTPHAEQEASHIPSDTYRAAREAAASRTEKQGELLQIKL